MLLTVVGLGPGPAEWVTAAAQARLREPQATVFARTRLHPALDGLRFESFDELYERAESMAEVEAAIARRLLEAEAEHVVLAVPGDGVLGEAIVQRLREGGASLEV